MAAQRIGKQHGDGVSLFARGAAGHPHAKLAARLLLQAQLAYGLAQHFKGVAITKECGHRNQNIARQLFQLVGVGLYPGQIAGQIPVAGGDFAAADASGQRAGFVTRKIKLQVFAHQGQQTLQKVGRRRFAVGFAGQHAKQLGQALGDFFGGENVIHHTSLDGRARHAVIFGGFRLLRQSKAACCLDSAQARYAVRAGAGQNHTDGGFAFFCRQRNQKLVHRGFGHHFGWGSHQLQSPFFDQGVMVGGHHINYPRLWHIAMRYFTHGERGFPAEDFHHHAAVGGRQMLQDHIGTGRIRTQVRHQLGECFQAAG